MSEFTQVILRLLWRFHPIAWLTTAIVRALSRIASWLEDEESWFQLTHCPEDCAFVGGWLALAEERLNELIAMKAMRLLKRRFVPPQPRGHHPARSVRTPQDILHRLTRLIARYHDHQRLYELRALKLQRLFEVAELQLEAIHHPIEAAGRIEPKAKSAVAPHAPSPADLAFGSIRPAIPPAQRIRAPPCLGLDPADPAHPNPQPPPARARDHA